MSNYADRVTSLKTMCEDLVAEITSYQEKDMSNAAQARRIRKATSELSLLSKDFRKESVDHHR